jgi:hypothetical protein
LATQEAHLEKAHDYQAYAESLENGSRTEREWGIIIRFYAAVHYVEAYLSTTREGTNSHIERRRAIGRKPELAELRNSFQMLYNLAWNSRYLTLPCPLEDVITAHRLLLQVRAVLNRVMRFDAS